MIEKMQDMSPNQKLFTSAALGLVSGAAATFFSLGALVGVGAGVLLITYSKTHQEMVKNLGSCAASFLVASALSYGLTSEMPEDKGPAIKEAVVTMVAAPVLRR